MIDLQLTKEQIHTLLAGRDVLVTGTPILTRNGTETPTVRLLAPAIPFDPPREPDWAGLTAFDNARHPLNDEQSDGGAGGIIQGWK